MPAFRALTRRPGSSLLIVMMLALGIGASTAMYSVVDAVLVRALPYREPASLVVVFADGTARGQRSRVSTTVGDFLDWRERATAFEGLAALRNESRRITSVEAPVVPLVHAVSANYFDVLGVAPFLGRGFLSGEDTPGRGHVVIVSYGLWQRIFGGDRTLVGRTIDLDGQPHTVVGVLRPDFYSAHAFATQPDLWVPSPFISLREQRTTRDILVYGRISTGLSLTTAQSTMAAVAAGVAADHPATSRGWGINLVPLREHAVGTFVQTAGLLLAAVWLVVLIACANVASLALARGSERASEVALRTALGAGRRHLVRQLVSDSLILSVAGGIIGAGIAAFSVRSIVQLIPASAGVPFLDRVAVDGRVLFFAALACLLISALCAVLPARQALRVDVVSGLRVAIRGGASAPARRLRNALVVGEIALAVVVAAAAGLMWSTFSNQRQMPLGFEAVGLAKLRMSLRGEQFQTPASRIAHFEELQRRLQRLPGVTSASAVSFEPVSPGVIGSSNVVIPGIAVDRSAPLPAVNRAVLPGYFETMSIPIVKGRAISTDDRLDSHRVAVITEGFARRYFAGVDPVGRTFSLESRPADAIDIVGVAADVAANPSDLAPLPFFYTPYAQNAQPVMTVVIRVGQGDPAGILREAERTAWSVSSSTNVYNAETMNGYLSGLNWRARFGSVLFGIFAVLALVLAALGLYATVSYTVIQRRREISVRLALGARSTDVLAMFMRDGITLVLTGVAIGVPVAMLLTRGMSGLLYGVQPGDPGVLTMSSLVLGVVAIAACVVPALRASLTDPRTAMQ